MNGDFHNSILKYYDSVISEGGDVADVIDELECVVDRYADETFIAAGGMKNIFSVYDKVTERTVAKGVLHSKTDTESLEKFINEVRISASLEHPNIIPIYDLGLTDDRMPFFTMKLVKSDSLQQIIDKLAREDSETIESFSRDRLLDIFLGVCDAVDYAHSKGILHLDIKPDNIQIGQFGEVFLCDWGLARFLNELTQVSAQNRLDADSKEIENSLDGFIKGSPGFMAPEQISGEVGKRSAKSDIYSLGCLLFNLLAYESPAISKDVNETLKGTLIGNVRDISSYRSSHSISGSLTSIVKKAMSTAIEDRYDSVKQMSKDIRSYRQGYATSVEDASIPFLIYLMLKRHKVFAVSGFMLICLSVYYTVNLNQKNALNVKLINNLEAEKASRMKISIGAADSLFSIFYNKYRERSFENIEVNLEKAHALNPDNSKMQLHLAAVYLGQLEIDKCLQIIAGHEKNTWFEEKCHLLGKNGSLPAIDKLREFLDHKIDVSGVINKGLKEHLTYTIAKKYSLADRIKFATYKISGKGEIAQSSDGLIISIIDRASDDYDFLKNLPIKSLTFVSCRISDSSLLAHLKAKELNLYECQVVSLKRMSKETKKVELKGTSLKNLNFLMGSNIHHLIIDDKIANLSSLKRVYSLALLEVRGDKSLEQRINGLELSCEVKFIK